MRKFAGYAALAMFSSSLFATVPEKVELPIETIYTVERGFDTNDAAEVSVYGYLPDTCHKLAQGEAMVNHSDKTIHVRVEGYRTPGQICLEILTPFLEVIHVGPLPQGDYRVQSLTSPDLIGKLQVEPAVSDSRDDYLYAPVDSIAVKSADQSLESAGDVAQTLKVTGTYPMLLKGCMRLTELRTYAAPNNVLIVQPISQIFEDGKCNAAEVDPYNRFSVSKKLESSLRGKTLVHVRTLNGRALNKVVDLTAAE